MRPRSAAAMVAIVAATFALAIARPGGSGLWPPVVALVVILVTRRALVGLLAGGVAGAVLLSGGNPLEAGISVVGDHFLPSLGSPWKRGAIVFTLLLGGFAALLEAGGGLATLLRRVAGRRHDPARRLEFAAGGLGLLCFFDGLANSMVVGRVSLDLADRSGVARAKLAYIVDSTSSAVACVAFVSTWIAFQLSMIDEAFALAGRDANPYAVFLESLPWNFYCWFTLVLLFVSIRQRFHPGPMAAHVRAVEERTGHAESGPAGDAAPITALLPLGVLLTAFFAGFIALGSPRPVLPLSREKLVAAFGSDAGPMVLILAAAAASLAALLLFPPRDGRKWRPALGAFARGLHAMLAPIAILLAAWIMGSVIGALGTAELIAGLATRADSTALMPALTFLTGAIISLATGTSWGTMGILFPLAVPAAAAAGGGDGLLTIIVAAVFSGAVFGDHCSPFSDTTIVTSISCGVDPHTHVVTQAPYALITATIAVGAGFLPAGFGMPAWISLVTGTGLLLLLPRLAGLLKRPA